MFKNRVILFLILVFIVQIGNSQDTLRLLNGKTKIVFYDKYDSDQVYYFKAKQKGDSLIPTKSKKVFLENVFQVALKNGETVQIYKQDTLLDQFLSIEEMKLYLAGIRLANKKYSTKKTAGIGVVVGLASGGLGLFYGIIPCGIYGGVAASIQIDNNKPALEDTEENKVFNAGYYDQSKIKQRNAALISSGISFLTSVFTLQILYNNGIIK